MLESLLKKIGLTDKEAKVYLATLELGEDSVQNIAKKAKVNRPNTYVILDKLIKMGLASTVERGKKTIYIAENPKELTSILEKEKREIEAREKELAESMTQLKALYNRNNNKPTVRFFEGLDGLESLDRITYPSDSLGTKRETKNIIPLDILEELFPDRRKKSVGDRVKLGLKSRLIYTRSSKLNIEENKDSLRTAIHLPRDKYPFTASLAIYPGLGIKIFYFDKEKPFGVLIESAELARNFELFYDLAWTGAEYLQKKDK